VVQSFGTFLQCTSFDLLCRVKVHRSCMARSPADGSGDAALQSNVEDDLAAMGFAAPVTKEQAGRRYHKELARQVRWSQRLGERVHCPRAPCRSLMQTTV